MSLSNQLEQDILDHFFGLSSKTAAATFYVSLHTGDPGEDGALLEVSGNGYARTAVTNSSSTWTRTVSQIASNTAISFSGPTPSTFGTVTHFGIWKHASSQTAANFVAGSALDTPRTTVVGVGLSFASGDLTITID